MLRPEVTVPGREAWLWKNAEALSMVQQGINEARQGVHADPPDLAAAANLASKVKE